MRKRLTDVIGGSECDGKKENIYSIKSFKIECIGKIEEECPNATSKDHVHFGKEKAEVDVIKKLGQLEDIEEELGIDLVTLFKALNMFYSKKLGCYCPRPTILFKSVDGEWYLEWIGTYHRFSEFGNTWALTKEELE